MPPINGLLYLDEWLGVMKSKGIAEQDDMIKFQGDCSARWLDIFVLQEGTIMPILIFVKYVDYVVTVNVSLRNIFISYLIFSF